MPLVKVSEILQDAKEKEYGVPAYNLCNYETMENAINAAEAVGLPVIIMLYPTWEVMPMETFVMLAKDLARRAKVPVGVHLDHTADFNIAMRAIAAGFPSVMYDGSALPEDVNINTCQQIVKIAHPMGIDVEGEIGHVGIGMNVEDFKNVDLYTRPEQLERFVSATGVDSCAVAIGNSHGVYIEQPEIAIPLLAELRKTVEVPLVLHGSSGIPDDQLSNAIVNGICKVNIATEMYAVMYGVSREVFAPEKGHWRKANDDIKAKMVEYMIAKHNVLNPKGCRVI